MEDTGRPRKVQKLEHSATDSVADGAALTAVADREENAQEATESQGSPNEPSNDPDDNDETAGTAAASAAGNEKENSAAPTLSKNQLKKRIRHEKWEAGRELRKVKKKEKIKEKKKLKRVAREQAAHDAPDAGENGAPEVSGARAARSDKRRAVLLPVTFILDCGYDGLMVDKERKSLASQLTRSYADNARSPYRAHLVVSSFNGFLKERFDTVLEKTHEQWKGVTFLPDDYMAAAEAAKSRMSASDGGQMAGLFSGKADTNAEEEGETVYLTSDSPDTLTELKPYSTYIIGGIVDKNRHKGLCYKSAMDKGLKTAKLPIGDYMKMNSRFVLATNHVVEIMLKWLELGDWGEAFMQVMPKRKGGELKGKKEEGTPVQQINGQQTEGQGSVTDEEAGGEEAVAEEGAEEATEEATKEATK